MGFKAIYGFLISNFRRVLNAVCFLLCNSPGFEFYIPKFRKILFHFNRQVGMEKYLPAYEDGTDKSVPKRFFCLLYCTTSLLQTISTLNLNVLR